jgi:hypothetical protein
VATELFELNCPFCDKLYKLPREKVLKHQGKSIHCRKCGQPFSIPAPPEHEVGDEDGIPIAVAAGSEAQQPQRVLHQPHAAWAAVASEPVASQPAAESTFSESTTGEFTTGSTAVEEAWPHNAPELNTTFSDPADEQHIAASDPMPEAVFEQPEQDQSPVPEAHAWDASDHSASDPIHETTMAAPVEAPTADDATYQAEPTPAADPYLHAAEPLHPAPAAMAETLPIPRARPALIEPESAPASSLPASAALPQQVLDDLAAISRFSAFTAIMSIVITLVLILILLALMGILPKK